MQAKTRPSASARVLGNTLARPVRDGDGRIRSQGRGADGGSGARRDQVVDRRSGQFGDATAPGVAPHHSESPSTPLTRFAAIRTLLRP